MGSVTCLPEGCLLYYGGYSDFYRNLITKYRQDYQYTIFYHTCIRALKGYNERHPEIRSEEDFNQSQTLKRSLIDSHYYSHISIEATDSNSRFSIMSENEKKRKVIELIRDSYILLDLSDVFEGKDLEIYEKEIKKEMFKNEESFLQASFMNYHSGTFQATLSESLKNFNTDAVNQLQNYISLCNLIKKDAMFCPEEGQPYQQFISFLLRELISKLILTCKEGESDAMDAQRIFSYVMTIINIMEDTVKILYNLRIRDSELSFNFSSMSEDSRAQIDPNTSIEESSGKTYLQFLNNANYYTLISSIVFSNSSLTNFLTQILKQIFKKELKAYKEKTNYQNMDLIKLLKRQKTGDYKVKMNVQGLFGHSKEDNYHLPDSLFPMSIKFLNKIAKKPEPILKLKIIAEMQRQIIKEFTKLQSQLQLDLLYDRNTSKIISCWLLNRERKHNIDNIISIMITYAFIHREYRISKKGSSIICFVQEIESILKWKIPCD